MMKQVIIDGHKIGPNSLPFIVAELSANHNGDINLALQTITQAKACGAHAIKLQTYTPDTMTLDCDQPDFQIKGGLWDGYSLYDLYKEAHTPYEWHKPLFDHARKENITCFSTPFDETAVDLLEDLNAPAYKIASFEATDIPLIQYVASTKKPMIISTGMANLEEIEELVDAARVAGCDNLILLHCISSYPAPVDQSNLATISDLADRFDTVVGLSDHTLGTTVSVAAVTMGACFIEKHFTLSRDNIGPDSSFSIEPDELSLLVQDTATAWQAMGQAGYDRKQAEQENVKFRRSLYITQDIKQGEIFSLNNTRRVRPGFGLPPKYYPVVLGKKSSRNLSRGHALTWEDIVL